MRTPLNMLKWAVVALSLVGLTGCGTVATLGKLEDGAAAEASKMWDRWVEGNGDIAVATTWERKVQKGVTANDIEQILRQVASERNMKDVGTLPLSRELEARTGQCRHPNTDQANQNAQQCDFAGIGGCDLTNSFADRDVRHECLKNRRQKGAKGRAVTQRHAHAE